MIRDGNRWREIGWDEALDLASDKLAAAIDRHGPLSILYYQGAGNMGILKRMGARFFDLLGGATVAGGSLCDAAGAAGIRLSYGINQPHDMEDIVSSRLVIIWGRNPAVTNIHLLPFLKEAKRRGAILVLIDPRRTETARHVDIHLAPRPGTDSLLSLGIAKGVIEDGTFSPQALAGRVRGLAAYKEIVDALSITEVASRCEVPEKDLASLARLYATVRPAAILAGMGVQHYADGAETVRAIGALPILTGNVGIPGGGLSYAGSSSSHFDGVEVAAGRRNPTRRLPKPLIGTAVREAQDPPVRAAWIAGANPVLQSPNPASVGRALEGLDFVVVCEMFMTDTARMADLVLPVSSFLERDDLIGSYGHNWISPVNRASLPVGGSRSDLEIYQLLADRLGFGAEMAGSPAAWLRRLAKRYIEAGVTFDEIMSGPHRDPHAPKVPFEGMSFPTESGCYEFINPVFQPLESSSEFPYRLITVKPARWQLSWVLPEDQPPVIIVVIHPETAGERSVEDGGPCMIRSADGALRAVVKTDDRQRRDTVSAEIGGWMSSGHGINILTGDGISFQGDCACYNETSVTIEPCTEECVPGGARGER